MTTLFLTYLAVTGFAANGLKVIRHVGKAAALACRGCLVEAGSELVTAAVAPADAVLFQSELLASEICVALSRHRSEQLAQENREPLHGLCPNRFPPTVS